MIDDDVFEVYFSDLNSEAKKALLGFLNRISPTDEFYDEPLFVYKKEV